MKSEGLRRATIEGLARIHELAIGEGHYGIIFSIPDHPTLCGKYAKFKYNPTEFSNLQRAFDLGLQVPRPIDRVHGSKTFVMERINGENLAELSAKGKFSREIASATIEACQRFCASFHHNDLFARNVMLRDCRISAGVIQSGTPIVVDLERSVSGSSDEWKHIEEWLLRRAF